MPSGAAATPAEPLLSLPAGIGRALVHAAAMLACPLLTRGDFVTFCKKRNLSFDHGRLLRWERLGLILPVFRVLANESGGVHVPVPEGSDPFACGLAIDTAGQPREADVPAPGAQDEAFYSTFQVDDVRLLLSEMTLHVNMDSYLELADAVETLRGQAPIWMERVQHALARDRSHYRTAIALLCQAISNRYYPTTQTDQRRWRVSGGSIRWGQWLNVNQHEWDWAEYARQWNPREVEALFGLTPEKLKRAYETVASNQAFLDPLEQWYPLVQFVAVDMRRALKGDALLAQTLRDGALMLRALYRDLYGEELAPINEVHVSVRQHVPELEVRADARRYLEFVANRFRVNPQPQMLLMLEGDTEVHAVERIFDEVFGLHPGRCGIELMNLQGVSNATGGKQDRYQAIFRLIDYLHHRQTMVYLILDNEGQAINLKRSAREKASIHGHRRHVMRPEFIHVWKRSFEFDNFTDAELAAALTHMALGAATFEPEEIAAWRHTAEPAAVLGHEFRTRAGRPLPKRELFDAAFSPLLAPGSRGTLNARAIVRQLRKIIGLTVKNPLPVMQTIWARNQQSHWFSKKRKKP